MSKNNILENYITFDGLIIEDCPMRTKEGWGDEVFIGTRVMYNIEVISVWMRDNNVIRISYNEGMKKVEGVV